MNVIPRLSFIDPLAEVSTRLCANRLLGVGGRHSPVPSFGYFSKAFTKINRPKLFAYEPALLPSADFLEAKLADKVRFERFDENGHTLFFDDPVTFNRMIDDFIQSLPKQ